MKKIALVVVSFISMASLAACGNGSTPTPTITITQQAPSMDDPQPQSEAQQQATDEDLYVAGLRAMNNPILNAATDLDLLQMGYSVCDALNAGYSTNDIIAYMATEMVKNGQTSDMETEAVGYIIAAADTILCPNTF